MLSERIAGYHKMWLFNMWISCYNQLILQRIKVTGIKNILIRIRRSAMKRKSALCLLGLLYMTAMLSGCGSDTYKGASPVDHMPGREGTFTEQSSGEESVSVKEAPGEAGISSDCVSAGTEQISKTAFQKKGDIYLIRSAAELRQLAMLVNAGKEVEAGVEAQTASYLLTSDIDLTEYCREEGGWEPIGYKSPSEDGTGTWHYFNGTFDGGGHVITGLFIHRPEEAGQGLFGCREDLRSNDPLYSPDQDSPEYKKKEITTIKNLYIEDCDITGSYNTGGVMGGMWNFLQTGYGSIVIENCHVTGRINGGGATGGIVGSGTTVKNSSFQGSILSEGGAGGIAGEVYFVNGCAVRADVTGSGYVGGIGGVAVCVRNSYVSGPVTGYEHVGGIAGWGACLTGCYTRSDVTGYVYTGGLIGDIQSMNLHVPEGASARATIRGCLMGGRRMDRAEEKNIEVYCANGHAYNGSIYGFPGVDLNLDAVFPYRKGLEAEGFSGGMYEFSTYFCEALDFDTLDEAAFVRLLGMPEEGEEAREDVWMFAADHAFPNLAWERENGFGYTVTVIVQKGDSLWSLAKEVYGDPRRWREIYERNRKQMENHPDLIFPGMELDVRIEKER